MSKKVVNFKQDEVSNDSDDQEMKSIDERKEDEIEEQDMQVEESEKDKSGGNSSSQGGSKTSESNKYGLIITKSNEECSIMKEARQLQQRMRVRMTQIENGAQRSFRELSEKLMTSKD